MLIKKQTISSPLEKPFSLCNTPTLKLRGRNLLLNKLKHASSEVLMTKCYVLVLVIYVVTHETQKETVIDKVPHYHVSDIPLDLNTGIPRIALLCK